MPKKIEAWETVNGRIFKDEEEAVAYENKELEKLHRSDVFDLEFENIKDYIKNKSWFSSDYKDIPLDEIYPSYDEGGWDCTNKDNPIKICIYDWSNSDESCVYCGSPEERK